MLTTDLHLYESFFQQEKEYYLTQLQKFEAGKRLSFNFSTLALGGLWFIYRKLYLEAILLLIFVSIAVAIDFYVIKPTFGNTGNMIFFLAFGSILWVTIGFLANRFYIKKAVETIALVKSKYSDEDLRLKAISEKGGTSTIGLYATIVIAAFVMWLF